ncbi:MAG: penicillin-binding protein 2 [Bacteroidales bacterium]|nr:penicillin-binding protein 2 [Bacteroidales bacterium]
MAEIQTQKKKRDSITVVLWALYLLFIAAGIVIIGRILYIKYFWTPDPAIVHYISPHDVKATLEPTRGSILARDGRLLAMSTPMYQVFMDCTVQKEAFEKEKQRILEYNRKALAKGKPVKEVRDREGEWMSKAAALSAGLAEIYGGTAKDWLTLIRTNREKGGKYVKIGGRIGHETLQKVRKLPLFEEGQFKSGMQWEKYDTRQYPYGNLASRTIGYVKSNTKTPVSLGIEGKYNYELHGQEGYEWMKLTDKHKLIHNWDSSFVKPVDGRNVRTTLDVDIQDIADQALRRQIEANMEIEGGCVVVMDVETGAIRAMVNLLRDTTSGRLYETLNMAVGRAGEPGSVFKTTTLMSLLEDGKVTLETTIPTNHGDVKGFNRDDHIVDYERENKTNRISVLHGFEISSNYVFRRLAIDHYGQNPKQMMDKLYLYKLGEAFDFDLDGMATPSLPSPDSPLWSGTDLGSVAIGYSVAETPLHIVTFYNAIAGKGRMMKPYLVESIEENGTIYKKRGPSILNGSICSRATADTLTRALRRVTEEGTGKRMLSGAKCAIAGKTGTARIVLDPKKVKRSGPYEDIYGRRQYQATFVGFFPADAPKYSAIVVIYSNLSRKIFYGGTMPAKTFREIVDKIYALDPEGGQTLYANGQMPKWEQPEEVKKP